MARLFLAFVVFTMAAVVLKMVLIGLVLAGLIFRTKETIGLLILGGLWTLFKAYPVPCFVVGGVTGVIVFVRWATKKDDPPEPEQLSLPLSGDLDS